MNGLFINYRREDTAPYAGRICDFLKRAFPNNKVFMDIDAIDPGEDFIESINRTLAESKIVVAVIGPNWTKVTDGGGVRRLDNPDDYVVRELCAAHESSARVIPVLVGGASMPRSEGLPSTLRALARRHAIEISDSRFNADAERLGAAIQRVLENSSKAKVPFSQDSVMGEGDDSFADALTTFKTVLWTSYALGFLQVGVEIERLEDKSGVPALLLVYVLLMGFLAWFNIMLIRGKNWARMLVLALNVIALPTMLSDFPEHSLFARSLILVSLAVCAWLVYAMFTEPIKRIFVSRR